jgi:hypothetical protein
MTTLTSLARAEAVEAGLARPITTVRHIHVAERPLVFIPLALAGEACAPLAAMVGEDPGAPRLLVVAQPRNRAQRFAFAAELADVIVPYIGSYLAEQETIPASRGREERLRYADAPQVWMPSRAGISFGKMLGRSTRFRRTEGDYAVPESVPVLGRWLTYFAERAEVPGSCLMLAGVEVLVAHWATGQSPVEDQNLAAVVGWIDPPDGMSGRAAALAAEDPLRWPPSGPATDPTWDNEVLAHLITACDRAEDRGDGRARRAARAALERELAGQLRPAWELMWRAIGLLRALPEGATVARRWAWDRDSFTGYAEYLREGGTPQPRRDSAVTAARRLDWLERVQQSYAAQRAFDDPLVMAEHRLTGEAFAGRVTVAQPDRVDSSGRRARLRPLITVETADRVVMDQGAELTSPARPGQKARIVSVVEAADGRARVVLELAGGMGHSLVAPPGTVPGAGEAVCYAAFSDSYHPSANVPPAEQTPWTHGGPPTPYEPTDEDAREAWS